MPWIITTDFIADKDAPKPSNRNAVGMIGPRNSTLTAKEIVSAMSYDQLQKFRSIITARPAMRRKNDAKIKSVQPPISLMTTRNWLQTLGQAFKWFKKTERWIKPSGLETDELYSIFFLSKSETMRLSQSRAEKERLTKPKPTQTLDELAIYYKLATDGQRLFPQLHVIYFSPPVI
jgi:hypothetical protein